MQLNATKTITQREKQRLRKVTICIMKTIIAILIVGCLHVSAKGFTQTISLSVKNTSLVSIFKKIETQSGYVFFFNYATLEKTKPVTVSLEKVTLQQALDVCFRDQPLQYKIVNKNIVIQPKDEKKLPVTINAGVMEAEPPPAPPLRGRITDAEGKPLQGVSIIVERKGYIGTPIYTISNDKGEYEISVQPGDNISFSYVGYNTKKVKVDKETQLNVKLDLDLRDMDSVEIRTINTGYQKIRPEQSTGAVSQMNTREYESRISTNFADGLVNRLPGLMINNDVNFVSANPNGGTSTRSLFNIRGISTMSANQNPLIVVDGYPTQLSLDMIDPNEIESVTILKDAAAATVYGVRASNGVIVIVRKQANQGKPRFTFRATTGIRPKENYDRYRWADDESAIVTNYQRTLYSNSVNATSWDQFTNASGGTVRRQNVFYILAQAAAKMITPYQAEQSFNNLINYNNRADYSRLFLRNAVTQTYNLNVSGGTGNALYYITANYTGNQQSQINNNDYRMLLSGRSTLKLTKRLSLELINDYQEQKSKAGTVPAITSISPYERFQDENGTPAYVTGLGISPYYNNFLISNGLYDQLSYPLIDAENITDKTHTVNNRIEGNFNYKIGGGFNLSFGGIYETSRSDIEYYATEESSLARQYVNSYVSRNTDGTLKYNIPKGGYLRQQNASTSGFTARAQLDYNKRIAGLHSINGIIGAEVRKLVEETSLSTLFGYNDETMLMQSVDFTAITTSAITSAFQLGRPWQSLYTSLFNKGYQEDRFLSGYSNIVYSYDNKYILTGSMRIDQSNLFGTNPKYKYRPLWSVGVAWNIDKESFMQQVDWMRVLRLRMSHGFNGNVAKMSLPQVIAQAYTNTYTSPNSLSLRMVSMANSSLRWEQTKNFNLGVDYHIFKTVKGTVDYYRKNSIDLLGNTLIDPTIGPSPSLINTASINNYGVEFALNADWIATPKFNWNTGIVVARNSSKVVDVFQNVSYNPKVINSVGYVKGYPVGAMFAYRYAGLDTAGYPLIVNRKGTLYHTNNSSATSPTTILMASDTSGVIDYMGSSIPTINMGISNRVDVGDFYFFAMINYYGGFKVRVPRPNPAATRPLEGSGDYWKVKGDENITDVMALIAYSGANANDAYNYADKYVVKGDYITLGDLTASYRLNNIKFIKKAGFTNVELKAQASNLVTIGFNKYNYSMATGSFQKTYVTPVFTLALFTNF